MFGGAAWSFKSLRFFKNKRKEIFKFMKAYDIYKLACAIMFENEGEDRAFEKKFTPLLGILCEECLPYENSVREALGKETLPSAPKVASGEEEIPFCDALCRVALPYGLASLFWQDDGEVYNSALYRERYIAAIADAAKINFRDIADVYGGEAE